MAMENNLDEELLSRVLLSRNLVSIDALLENATRKALMTRSTATAATTAKQQEQQCPILAEYHARQLESTKKRLRIDDSAALDKGAATSAELSYRGAEQALVLLPSLLEWAMGVWLPPFPRHLRTMLNNRDAWGKKVNPTVLGAVANMLIHHAQWSNKNRSSSSSKLVKLVQFVFNTHNENEFSAQRTGCGGAYGPRSAPVALHEARYLAFLSPSFVPRDAARLDSKETINRIVSIAVVAAKSGNLSLVAALATRLLAAVVAPSDATDERNALFAQGPGSFMPLFPVRPKDYGDVQPLYFPARDPEETKRRSDAVEKVNKRYVFESLDAVVVELCGSAVARQSPDFAALLAHVAFAQLRMINQANRSSCGFVWKMNPKSGNVERLDGLSRVAMAPLNRPGPYDRTRSVPMSGFASQVGEKPFDTLSLIEQSNFKLVRSVGPISRILMWWDDRRGSRKCTVPATAAVVVHFVVQVLLPRFERRMAAEQQCCCCDPHKLIAEVMEWLGFC